MIFGLTFEKLLIFGLIAVMIVGPARLPAYSARLARALQAGKRALDGARSRVEEELGPEVGEIDWRKLDPRQYDPRRIIRSALLDESAPRSTPALNADSLRGGGEPLASPAEADTEDRTGSSS